MHWVAGGPVEAGAGLAAVVPIGEGWAGCRTGQSGAGETDPGRSSWAPGPLWPPCPSQAWASLRGTTNRGPHAGLRGQAVCPGGHLAAPDSQARPRERVWHSDCPPAPRSSPSWRASRTLGAAGSLAASRAEAGAAHSIAGRPRRAVAGMAAVQSEEAGRAGCGSGHWWGAGQATRPAHTPGRPPRLPTSLTEGPPPARGAGAGPTDVVTGAPVLTLAAPLTARPEVALGTGHVGKPQ